MAGGRISVDPCCCVWVQREADEEATRLKPSERKKAAARQKTHQRLRIIAGTAAGKWSVEPAAIPPLSCACLCLGINTPLHWQGVVWLLVPPCCFSTQGCCRFPAMLSRPVATSEQLLPSRAARTAATCVLPAGQRLFSPQGDQTRPMMEMVRGAVFNMISSMYGCQAQLPEESRWGGGERKGVLLLMETQLLVPRLWLHPGTAQIRPALHRIDTMDDAMQGTACLGQRAA